MDKMEVSVVHLPSSLTKRVKISKLRFSPTNLDSVTDKLQASNCFGTEGLARHDQVLGGERTANVHKYLAELMYALGDHMGNEGRPERP
jgi:hypothetical protein